jgi:hypothetical protein
MPMVRVWNRNSVVHKETFKGDEIVIQPGKFIMMDFNEANDFRGQFFTPKFNKGGAQTIDSMKYIEIDKNDYKAALDELNSRGEDRAKKTYVCMKCNKEFSSKRALLTHVKNTHSDELADDETREELDAELEGA